MSTYKGAGHIVIHLVIAALIVKEDRDRAFMEIDFQGLELDSERLEVRLPQAKLGQLEGQKACKNLKIVNCCHSLAAEPLSCM